MELLEEKIEFERVFILEIPTTLCETFSNISATVWLFCPTLSTVCRGTVDSILFISYSGVISILLYVV